MRAMPDVWSNFFTSRYVSRQACLRYSHCFDVKCIAMSIMSFVMIQLNINAQIVCTSGGTCIMHDHVSVALLACRTKLGVPCV